MSNKLNPKKEAIKKITIKDLPKNIVENLQSGINDVNHARAYAQNADQQFREVTKNFERLANSVLSLKGIDTTNNYRMDITPEGHIVLTPQ